MKILIVEYLSKYEKNASFYQVIMASSRVIHLMSELTSMFSGCIIIYLNNMYLRDYTIKPLSYEDAVTKLDFSVKHI